MNRREDEGMKGREDKRVSEEKKGIVEWIWNGKKRGWREGKSKEGMEWKKRKREWREKKNWRKVLKIWWAKESGKRIKGESK